MIDNKITEDMARRIKNVIFVIFLVVLELCSLIIPAIVFFKNDLGKKFLLSFAIFNIELILTVLVISVILLVYKIRDYIIEGSEYDR